MAVSLVQVTTSAAGDLGTTTSATITLPGNPTAGNLLVAWIRGGTATGDTLGISDGSNTWTATPDGANVGDSSDTHEMFYAANCAGGATTFTITQSQSGHSLRVIIAEFSGVQTSSPINDHGTASGSSATSSVTTAGTSTAIGDLVVTCAGFASAGTLTQGSGNTLGQVCPAGANARIILEWLSATGAGAQTNTVGISGSSNWATQVLTFKAAAAATGVVGKSVNVNQAVKRAYYY